MFWVYILRCADGSYYTGHTDNLEKRMGQYHAGECEGYVAARLPAKMVWSQECATRYEALSAEMRIKGWSRKKKEAMMQGNWAEVSRLAKNEPGTVRPEPVEGANGAQDRLIEGANGAQDRLIEGANGAQDRLIEGANGARITNTNKSAHPSTGSGRTDLLFSPPSGVGNE